MPTTSIDIPIRIRKLISEKGLMQKYVAKKAGLTSDELSRILCGRKILKIEHIVPICNALDVTPDDLFGFSPEQHTERK